MDRIIDIHAHVFPDAIAQKASDSICEFYNLQVRHSGTVSELLRYYDEAGISEGCIHSVAITPHYITSINRFISETAGKSAGRLTGFAAIHPEAENIPELVNEVLGLGMKGFKIHPDMQHFALDDPSSMEMFSAIEGKLPIIIHTGDLRYQYSHPTQMKKVLDAFPNLVCVCAHLGGWNEWEDAWRLLNGYDNAYIDTSSSLYALGPEKGREIIRHYSRERVLFGSDYPMWTPQKELERLYRTGLTDDEMELILYRNAEQLLNIT